MEKLKDLSLSPSFDKNEPVQTTSNSSSINDADVKVVDKYASLMEELQAKTDDFLVAIDQMTEANSKIAKDFEQKVKTLEEKLEQMEVKTITTDFGISMMESMLAQKNDNIQYWKQKFEMALRL